MRVFQDLDMALDAMKKESIDLKEDVFLTYTRFGSNPVRLEFNIKSRKEMIDPERASNLLAVKKLNEKKVKTLWSKKTFKDYVPFISRNSKCGDNAMRGGKGSMDEVLFKRSSSSCVHI